MDEITMKKQLIQWLFETRAFRAAPEHQPFWYTSGTIGPYYINTHFLFGSESEANRLLQSIDQNLDQPADLIRLLTEKSRAQYRSSTLYSSLIDRVVSLARVIPCDFISGGERRDFFFSFSVAQQLNKPHISLFKNREAWISSEQMAARRLSENECAGQKALHISDLVTEASSYFRAWIPAVEHLGAVMPNTMTIVDRNQGGREKLAEKGTQLTALLTIQDDLFEEALKMGLIDEGQFNQIIHFIHDPIRYQSDFMRKHPEFIRQQIAAGGRNAERALLYLEKHHGPEN